MANDILSPVLEPAAISDPRHYRLVLMWFKNDECNIKVQQCFDIGAMTYNVAADTTQVLCTNLNTGKDEVVAIIEGGATSEVSMELSRFLPMSKRSMLLRLAKENCGLRVYLLRGTRCTNPLSVDEFDVLEIIGGIRFTSAYARTEIRHKAITNAQEISESIQITGYNLFEVAKQSWATRGGSTVGPIVDIKICDTKVCGGLCDNDSDGCQVVFWVDTTGQVWYSVDQLKTETLSGQVTGYTAETIRALCCVDDQLVIIGDLAGVGTLWTADIEDVVSGDPVVWNMITNSTLNLTLTPLPVIEACEVDTQNVLWMVGANGHVSQYDSVTGLVTLITAIPNVTETYQAISIQSAEILIGGTAGIFIQSPDGGRSFSVIEVTDPATGLALAVDITAIDVMLSNQWSIGLADGRILFTLDGGTDWFNHILPTGIAGGAITDLHFDATLVGYATTAGGDVLKTYFGPCRPWILMPETDKTLPANGGFNALTVCTYDPDIIFAAGESTGGAGFIQYGSSTEA